MSELWHYFRDNQSDIARWTWTTVWLAGGSLLAGLVIALPLGWLASRYRWTYPPLVTIAGLIYTIPSIVLFVTMPGLLGTKVLDPINVGVALTAYTVALLVRVVADGLSSVSDRHARGGLGHGLHRPAAAVRGAVPDLGTGDRRRPAGGGGVERQPDLGRVAGRGGATRGTVRPRQPGVTLVPIVLGVIIIMLLAFAFDAVILLGIRLMTPWQRAVRAR